MRHGMPEEARSEAGLGRPRLCHDLPLVATNNAYFPDRDFYEAPRRLDVHRAGPRRR